MDSRVVTKILSCCVYAICRRGSEQQGSSFGSIFLLLPLKVARGSLLVAWRKSLVPALTEIPGGGQKTTTVKDLKE